jgi:type IV secretion system protein VirB4
MTRVNTEQLKYTPWFAKAGAACSIVPISRFVNDRIFALKGGGYGCLFSLAGIDEEGLTDQELEAEMRSIEGALRGLPEGACLYQYTRVMSGFDLPRKEHYANPGHAGIRGRPAGVSRKDGRLPPHRFALVLDAGTAQG